MDTIVKSWKELPEDIDFMGNGWCFGSDGYKWHISNVLDDGNLTEIRYELPVFISDMLRINEENVSSKIKRDIRIALGIK